MSKKLTTKEFIEKAKKVHGDKYDYSKVDYINAHTKVCIICSEHGEFWQKPCAHLRGNNCPICSNKILLTTEEFIERAKKVHGNKYDYSKVEYINNKTKVCIICSEHGEFWQKPNGHLGGNGCPKCAGTKKLNNEEFIENARKIHRDKYDYSKVEYKNYETKVCIICPIHGEFWQTPHAHLNGQGCSFCSNTKKLTTREFIERAKKVHGNKYDYSKVEYINNRTKVRIICPEHGEFWQKSHAHLRGNGCPKCGGVYKLNKQEFIEKAKEVHRDKYDYSKVEYENSEKKVCIICPAHGEFWQTPHNHLNKQGCPFCNESKLEKCVKEQLIKNNINFQQQKTFDWLKSKGNLYLDFYLPDYNIAIECQGEQHFKPIKHFGGINAFINCQKRDFIKNQLCRENKIKIIYYALKMHDYFSKLETNINELIEKICQKKV